jgi:membrane protease YdiL (CAAX protease family)
MAMACTVATAWAANAGVDAPKTAKVKAVTILPMILPFRWRGHPRRIDQVNRQATRPGKAKDAIMVIGMLACKRTQRGNIFHLAGLESEPQRVVESIKCPLTIPEVRLLEQATDTSPLGPAAFAYAITCVLALALLAHIQTPLDVFSAPHPGAVFLGRDPVQGLLWGLGLGGLLAASSQAVTHWTAWGKRLSRLLTRLVGSLHPADALLLAALSSLAEELVFRGVVLPYAGLAASSLLFGLAHIIPRQGLWPWSLWAVLAGVLLGWSALATDGLLAPILAHFTVNAVGLLLMSERRQ